jgi:hypothetical protein
MIATLLRGIDERRHVGTPAGDQDGDAPFLHRTAFPPFAVAPVVRPNRLPRNCAFEQRTSLVALEFVVSVDHGVQHRSTKKRRSLRSADRQVRAAAGPLPQFDTHLVSP